VCCLVVLSCLVSSRLVSSSFSEPLYTASFILPSLSSSSVLFCRIVLDVSVSLVLFEQDMDVVVKYAGVGFAFYLLLNLLRRVTSGPTPDTFYCNLPLTYYPYSFLVCLGLCCLVLFCVCLRLSSCLSHYV
jgi:hypothetical protein